MVAALAVCSCLGAPEPIPPTSVSVQNISAAACTHSGAVVTCGITMDVLLNNATLFDTTVTIVTNDTLLVQWHGFAIGTNVNYKFPSSQLVKTDSVCVKPQDSISVWLGPTVGLVLVASAQIPAITLTCK